MQRRVFCRSAIAAAVAATLPAGRLLAAAHAVVEQPATAIRAVTGAGAPVELDPAAVVTLGKRIAGRLLTAGDDGYDTARQVMNAAIDKRPALIVQCTGAADVRYAVEFARERSLLVAVKCGGHSYGGKSTCDDGMMIDLTPLRGVRVNPATRTARVAGGSLLGQLDHEAMAFGLVTTAGTVSHTGVGGLTLGGGFGRLARRFGLALDNVRAVELITADGDFIRASENENQDLYWAARGGGGNFGVATAFEFQLHPMQREVGGGEFIFPLDRARELLAFYADFSAAAPDDLYCDLAMISPPGDAGGFVMIHVCYSGPADRTDAVLKPIRELGEPLQDNVRPIDYVALQKSWDNSDPRALGEYLKSGFTTEITAPLIDAIIDGYDPDPGRTTTVFFQQSGGAIERVPTTATAFAHRYAQHSMFSTVGWPFGSDRKPHIEWLRRYWSTLAPFTSGFYTNESSDESQAVVNANYRENYARLAKIKNRFDPDNLFRLNANIAPEA